MITIQKSKLHSLYKIQKNMKEVQKKKKKNWRSFKHELIPILQNIIQLDPIISLMAQYNTFYTSSRLLTSHSHP